MLRARLGEDIYKSWFASMEFEAFDGRVVRATVPVKFLKNWIQSHYSDDLLAVLRGGVQRRRARRRGAAPAGSRHGRASAARRRASPARGKAWPGAEPAAVETRRVAVHPGRRADHGAHERRRLRRLAARSALHLRQFRRRPGQPHGARRGHPGRRHRARRGARLQSALPARQRRARQDPPPARHRLGGEAAHAQGQRALPDGGALPLPVRRGRQEPGRDGLQGQVPHHRHPADRRPRVHARREDRAGVRAHHQLAARRRPPGGGGFGPPAGAARRPQRPHALAPAARPHHRDQPDGRGAAAQGAARSGRRRSGRSIPPSSCPARWWRCSPTG